MGLSVDYLSPTLFVTDILLFLLLLVLVVEFFFFRHFKSKQLALTLFVWTNKQKIPIAFFLFLLLSCFLSARPFLALYGLAKTIEVFFFAQATYWFFTTQKRFYSHFFFVLGLGIAFESFIAFCQYATQGSLGGILYFFGERTFNSQTPGIATSAVEGLLLLRSYGTFPHPNVLAGFLVIGMTILLFRGKARFSTTFQRFCFVVLSIGTGGLFLTFSRTAFLIWVLLLIIFLSRYFFKQRLFFFFLVVLMVIGIVLLPHRRPFSFSEESFVLRENLIIAAVKMFFDHPFFGTGLRHFFVFLPYYLTQKYSLFYLQPVHNIFLLWIVETGIVGALALGLFFKTLIGRISRRRDAMSISLIIIVCILGSVDHYFLTLQQGNLLLGLVLGVVWSRTRILS